ncbi:MAG: hypothetical protein M3Y28_01120 [Armatimonadota bacterium]|nr:hypothetical protein [Armatimonadota bacterium]
MTRSTHNTVTVPSAPRRDLTRFVAFTVCLGIGLGALTPNLAHLCASVADALCAYLGAI